MFPICEICECQTNRDVWECEYAPPCENGETCEISCVIVLIIIIIMTIIIIIIMVTLQECILRRPLHQDGPQLLAEARPLGRKNWPEKKFWKSSWFFNNIVITIWHLFIRIIIIITWEEKLPSYPFIIMIFCLLCKSVLRTDRQPLNALFRCWDLIIITIIVSINLIIDIGGIRDWYD